MHYMCMVRFHRRRHRRRAPPLRPQRLIASLPLPLRQLSCRWQPYTRASLHRSRSHMLSHACTPLVQALYTWLWPLRRAMHTLMHTRMRVACMQPTSAPAAPMRRARLPSLQLLRAPAHLPQLLARQPRLHVSSLLAPLHRRQPRGRLLQLLLRQLCDHLVVSRTSPRLRPRLRRAHQMRLLHRPRGPLRRVPRMCLQLLQQRVACLGPRMACPLAFPRLLALQLPLLHVLVVHVLALALVARPSCHLLPQHCHASMLQLDGPSEVVLTATTTTMLHLTGQQSSSRQLLLLRYLQARGKPLPKPRLLGLRSQLRLKHRARARVRVTSRSTSSGAAAAVLACVAVAVALRRRMMAEALAP